MDIALNIKSILSYVFEGLHKTKMGPPGGDPISLVIESSL